MRRNGIQNRKGETLFEQKGVVVPEQFSQLDVNVVASKYFYGDVKNAGVPVNEGGREDNFYHIVERVVITLGAWGVRTGTITKEERPVFEKDLRLLLLNQYGAFNSPVWFNLGLNQLYGVKGEKRVWAATGDPKQAGSIAFELSDSMERSQASACFIISLQDSIEDIWRLMGESARLFKYGSGVGSDWSKLRSKKDTLSGGGRPSGPVSFMLVQDSTGATIKSGGAAGIAFRQPCIHVRVGLPAGRLNDRVMHLHMERSMFKPAWEWDASGAETKEYAAVDS